MNNLILTVIDALQLLETMAAEARMGHWVTLDEVEELVARIESNGCPTQDLLPTILQWSEGQPDTDWICPISPN